MPFPLRGPSRAIGVAYGVAGLGNAAGPLVGGLLTQTLGWRWIFWLLVPLALAAFVDCRARRCPRVQTTPCRVAIDLTGLALIIVGIGSVHVDF